jgi:hypothetical protein
VDEVDAERDRVTASQQTRERERGRERERELGSRTALLHPGGGVRFIESKRSERGGGFIRIHYTQFFWFRRRAIL